MELGVTTLKYFDEMPRGTTKSQSGCGFKEKRKKIQAHVMPGIEFLTLVYDFILHYV